MRQILEELYFAAQEYYMYPKEAVPTKRLESAMIQTADFLNEIDKRAAVQAIKNAPEVVEPPGEDPEPIV